MSVLFYETSEHELTHHGILGQKWGIRRYQNKDGSLTAAGRKRLYDQTGNLKQDIAIRANYGFNYGKLSNDLEESKKELMNALKFAKNFNDNGELVDRYKEKAARLAAKEFSDNTPEDIDHFIKQYKYGDFDQGYNNSFQLYCKDKGIDYEHYISNVVYPAEKKYYDIIDGAVNSYVENNSDMILPFNSKEGNNAVKNYIKREIDGIETSELWEANYWYRS